MALFTLALSPLYVLSAGILVVLILDILLRENANPWLFGVTLGILVMAAAFVINTYLSDYSQGTLFRYGEFYLIFGLIALLSSIVVVFTAWKDFELEIDLGVFYSLLLLANIGGIVVASANNFIPLYIGYELFSIPAYAMVAFRKTSRDAAEAALKIFLLGALSSAFILYGLSMYYGATATFAFGAVAKEGARTLQYAAVGLIASGCGFKIGLVPFHVWIPDVYQGAPVSVVNFLAASSKKMAFAFVFQLFFAGMAGWYEIWGVLFAVLAALSVILGNAAAVIQSRLMRIIAYSTIAQAGYIAIGVAAYGLAGNDLVRGTAMQGLVLHIVAHVLMKGAAIAIILLIIDTYGDDQIENVRGMFYKAPYLSGCLAIAFFSLMGIPPLAGFFGKFFLFLAAVNAGLVWLAIIGVVGSAVSIFYYTKVLRVMAEKPVDDVEIKTHPGIMVLITILTLLTIIVGIFGTQLFDSSIKIVDELVTYFKP